MKLTGTRLVNTFSVSYGNPRFYQRVHSSLSLSMPWRWMHPKVGGPPPPSFQNTRHHITEDCYLNTPHWLEVKSDVKYRLHVCTQVDLLLRAITTFFLWLPFRHLLKNFDPARSKPPAYRQVFASRYDPLTTHSCSPPAFRNLYVDHNAVS
jgi:hypothetical protein